MTYRPLWAALLCLLILAGCTNSTTKRIDVVPMANSCQVTEIRPTAMSTLVLGICWDAQGAPIGMAGAGGQAVVSIPLAVLGAGAIVGGAYVLGGRLGGLAVDVEGMR